MKNVLSRSVLILGIAITSVGCRAHSSTPMPIPSPSATIDCTKNNLSDSDRDDCRWKEYATRVAIDAEMEEYYDSLEKAHQADLAEDATAAAAQHQAEYEQYLKDQIEIAAHQAGCIIKGSINYETGEKIYRIPGQEYYSETEIDTEDGERWFCTEQEAIAAGWRKAGTYQQGDPAAGDTSSTFGYAVQDSNVRAGPGMQYEILDVAAKGQEVTVIGCDVDCNWYALDDGTWIAAYLVTITDAPDTSYFEPDLYIEPDAYIEPEAECLIKGNVSYNTGEKIYHVPGQEYYDETVINPAYGERWFCTEQEAVAASWRRSYR